MVILTFLPRFLSFSRYRQRIFPRRRQTETGRRRPPRHADGDPPIPQSLLTSSSASGRLLSLLFPGGDDKDYVGQTISIIFIKYQCLILPICFGGSPLILRRLMDTFGVIHCSVWLLRIRDRRQQPLHCVHLPFPCPHQRFHGGDLRRLGPQRGLHRGKRGFGCHPRPDLVFCDVQLFPQGRR